MQIPSTNGFMKIPENEINLPQSAFRLHKVGMRLGGYAIRWNDPMPNTGFFFDPNTNFSFNHPTYPMFFDNGKNPDIGTRPIGFVDYFKKDDDGLYVAGVVNHDEPFYIPLLGKLIGKELIWSLAPAIHMQNINEDRLITDYPIVDFSIKVVAPPDQTEITSKNSQD